MPFRISGLNAALHPLVHDLALPSDLSALLPTPAIVGLFDKKRSWIILNLLKGKSHLPVMVAPTLLWAQDLIAATWTTAGAESRAAKFDGRGYHMLGYDCGAFFSLQPIGSRQRAWDLASPRL